MDILKPSAVVGTNSWGSAAYGKMLRGESVGVDTIRACFERDYGLGKAQKMIGEFGTEDVIISAKFTPTGSYKSGQVRKSFEKDLQDFNRDYVDIYWLHLPSDIEANLSEIIDLYKEGKIKHIGISNFTLEECVKAKAILDKAGIPIYGVQNHYSLINREWEKNGLVDWCSRKGISFWAWAVLEEGMLTDPKVKTKMSLMKLMFNRKKRKLHSLYQLMEKVGDDHGITIPQVAMAFCASKGIVPVCGCRKPYQVDQLLDAVSVCLSDSEIKSLENEADKLNVKILGADMFRFAVKKSK